MKEQLQSALIELKTANTIISLLREDINKATALEATNLPKPSLPCGSSKHERTNVGWIPIVHNPSKGKKTPMVSSRTAEKSCRSSNRFTPLANLPENNLTKYTQLVTMNGLHHQIPQKNPQANLIPVIKYLQ
jgi:hypothetical protein